MVRRSRSIPLPEPASLTNSLKICERCRLVPLFAHLHLAQTREPRSRGEFLPTIVQPLIARQHVRQIELKHSRTQGLKNAGVRSGTSTSLRTRTADRPGTRLYLARFASRMAWMANDESRRL